MLSMFYVISYTLGTRPRYYRTSHHANQPKHKGTQEDIVYALYRERGFDSGTDDYKNWELQLKLLKKMSVR